MKSKPRVFLSFDFERDRLAAWSIIAQERHKDSPFQFENWMLKEAAPERDWFRKAVHQINQCHTVLIVCGIRTHEAHGVLMEAHAATLLNKRIVQVRARSGQHVQPVIPSLPLFDRGWLSLALLLPPRSSLNGPGLAKR